MMMPTITSPSNLKTLKEDASNTGEEEAVGLLDTNNNAVASSPILSNHNTIVSAGSSSTTSSLSQQQQKDSRTIVLLQGELQAYKLKVLTLGRELKLQAKLFSKKEEVNEAELCVLKQENAQLRKQLKLFTKCCGTITNMMTDNNVVAEEQNNKAPLLFRSNEDARAAASAAIFKMLKNNNKPTKNDHKKRNGGNTRRDQLLLARQNSHKSHKSNKTIDNNNMTHMIDQAMEHVQRIQGRLNRSSSNNEIYDDPPPPSTNHNKSNEEEEEAGEEPTANDESHLAQERTAAQAQVILSSCSSSSVASSSHSSSKWSVSSSSNAPKKPAAASSAKSSVTSSSSIPKVIMITVSPSSSLAFIKGEDSQCAVVTPDNNDTVMNTNGDDDDDDDNCTDVCQDGLFGLPTVELKNDNDGDDEAQDDDDDDEEEILSSATTHLHQNQSPSSVSLEKHTTIVVPYTSNSTSFDVTPQHIENDNADVTIGSPNNSPRRCWQQPNNDHTADGNNDYLKTSSIAKVLSSTSSSSTSWTFANDNIIGNSNGGQNNDFSMLDPTLLMTPRPSTTNYEVNKKPLFLAPSTTTTAPLSSSLAIMKAKMLIKHRMDATAANAAPTTVRPSAGSNKSTIMLERSHNNIYEKTTSSSSITNSPNRTPKTPDSKAVASSSLLLLPTLSPKDEPPSPRKSYRDKNAEFVAKLLALKEDETLFGVSTGSEPDKIEDVLKIGKKHTTMSMKDISSSDKQTSGIPSSSSTSPMVYDEVATTMMRLQNEVKAIDECLQRMDSE